jgi:predicted DNA-binding protein
MVRTVISLDEKDKAWLDKKSKKTGKAMTCIVQEAIQEYRVKDEREHPSFGDLLQKSRGTWKKGDGLKYQRKTRNEWK